MQNEKEYSLKPIEQQVLQTQVQMSQTALSNLLTFIATERLAYNVTEHTQFRLGDNLATVTISEAVPEQPAETEPAAVETPTAKAMKGKK